MCVCISFASQKTRGNIWKHFWLSLLEEWHLVGRSQGSFKHSIMPGTAKYYSKKYPAPNVNGAEFGKSFFRRFFLLPPILSVANHGFILLPPFLSFLFPLKTYFLFVRHMTFTDKSFIFVFILDFNIISAQNQSFCWSSQWVGWNLSFH